MSCSTLNQSAIQLDISVGQLPEGFCPASMQELANAIGARIIISPSETFNTFAIGSTAPASNVGPWLKDCEAWFVFDDATASYVPTEKGGFSFQSYFISSGSFVVPEFIYKLKITAIGAGGGGFDNGASSSSGAGGGGSFGCSIVDVIPGQVIPYTIGAGGVAGNPGTAGGATTILGFSAGGGAGGVAIGTGGAGGTATGFTINLSGQYGMANTTGSANEADANGGDAAGWGGKGGVVGANATTVGRNGLSPGGGGSGSANGVSTTAGNGAGGAILIEW